MTRSNKTSDENGRDIVEALLKDGARKVLDRHGFNFQQKAIAAICETHAKGLGAWGFEVAEFPVATASHETRVDAILAKGDVGQRSFMVCEFKRVDPQMGRWCFFKTPHKGGGGRAEEGTCEYLFFSRVGTRIGTCLTRASGEQFRYRVPAFDLAIEVKHSARESESTGRSRDAIEDACTQVSRGVNGLVEYFASLRAPDLTLELHTRIYGAVITTADLFVSDHDLRDSDLSTGKLRADDLNLRRVPWLYYRYMQSPSVIHSMSRARNPRSVAEDVRTHDTPVDFFNLGVDVSTKYARSIAIVSAESIPEFLKATSDLR